MPAVPLAALALLVGALTPVKLDAQACEGGPEAGGETGIYLEGSSISGRPERRPGTTMRMYARPSFDWMGMRVGTNVLWSTEQDLVAQTMNRYYLNPCWSSGELHLGDYVPDLSRYTARAAAVRGGGLELSPGAFRLAFTGGRTQETSRLSTFDAAPGRTLWAGLLGLGQREEAFLEVAALRAVDDEADTDSLIVAPQENLVAAASGGIALADGRFTLRAGLSGSLHTRDTRTGELGELIVPDWMGALFTPRAGSRADYAWDVEARAVFPHGSLGAQAEYVGPGFVTLGNPYLANDQRHIRAVGSLKLFAGRLSASGSVGARRDNLAGDRSGTTRRTTGTLTVAAVPAPSLNTAISLLVNGLTRETELARRPTDPDPGITDSLRIANATLAITLTQQARFHLGGMPQNVTLGYSLQRVDDTSPRLGDRLDSRTHALSLDYGITLAREYRLSVRPAYQRFEGAGREETYPSVGLGISRRAPDSPWSGRLRSTYTGVDGGGKLRQDAAFELRLGEEGRDRLSARLRHTVLDGTTSDFTEFSTSLSYSRQW